VIKCDKCRKARKDVHLTCVETLGKLEKVYLCENRHDKLENHIKIRGIYEEK
jgi:hypothetical protein